MTGSGPSEDLSQPVMQSYMIGVFLAVNAIRDVYLAVEGPDCIHMKTQFVQGNHDWLSTLTSVSGYHRIANTALHPVDMTGSREEALKGFVTRMAERQAVEAVLVSSMPMAFITGADYERLCADVSEATGKTVLPVPGKSLSGDWLDGYDETLLALAKGLDVSGGAADPSKVAIVGNLFDRNEGDQRGNVAELRRLVESLGLTAPAIWLEGRDFRDLFSVRDAGTIVSLPYGRRAAKRLARRTGARLLECGLPFGLTASERFVRAVAAATGREDRAEEVIARELGEVVPSLEWIVPSLLQDRRWGYAGDPHLVLGLKESAGLVGAELPFAVITNVPHHARGLQGRLGEDTELLVYPRQRTMGRFLSERMSDGSIDVLVANSEGVDKGGAAATVEIGFPSIYVHRLYDRPYLGFRGFLAFIESVINAMRRQQREESHGRHEADRRSEWP